MENEQVFIQIDNKRIELFGDELKAFIEQREKDKAEAVEQAAAIEAQAAAKASAVAKLTALGLTEDEVNALIGGI